MTGNLKKTIISLAFLSTLCISLWAASEALAGVLAVAQGTFNPVGGTAVESAPVIGEVNLEDDVHRTVHYETPKTYTGKKISFEFQNEDIRNIIKMISEASGKKIVVPDTISGKVTLKLRDVPWDQALNIVLAVRNLGVEESDGVLTISDLPTFGCGYRTRTPLSPSELQRLMSRPPLVKKMFTPKHVPISEVTEALNKLKSEHGKIVAIGNDVYVEDKSDTIATMTQSFMRIDQVVPQILIEAIVIEAGPSLIKALGLQWKACRAVKDSDVDTEAGSKAVLDYDIISKAKSLALNAQLSANESDPRIILAPRIIAPNHQKVSIKKGRQIYCPPRRGPDVQNKELLMELEVTPHLEDNGQTLTLDLILTKDAPQSEASGDDPALNIKEAGTKLVVKYGETIVIGGIIAEGNQVSEGHMDQGQRYSLSDWLVKDSSDESTEILIFVTATIIPVND